MPSSKTGKKRSRGTAGKKKAPGRRKQASVRGGRKGADGEVFLLVLTLLLFLFCLLLFIATFEGGGYIGRAICSLEYGMLGRLSRLFPFALFVGQFFLMANVGNKRAYRRVFFGILLFCLLCGAWQLFTEGVDPANTVGDYFALGSDYHVGGGAVGGAIALALVTAFGRIGGGLVLILALLSSLICMTHDSLVDFLVNLFSGLPFFNREEEDEEEREYERNLKREVREQEKRRKKEERTKKRIERLQMQLEKERSQLGAEGDYTSLGPGDPALDVKKGKKSLLPTPLGEEKGKAKEKEKEKNSSDIEIHGLSAQDLPYEEEAPAQEAPKAKGTRGRKGKAKEAEALEELSIPQDRSSFAEPYVPPSLDLLSKGSGKTLGVSREELQLTASKLEQILSDFGVEVSCTDVSCGPTVTRYELQPEPGVKVSKIVNLSDDIKLNLAAADIRIEAPIPGKAAVGIEVPNKEVVPVLLRELLSSQEFKGARSKLTFAVGKDIAGKVVVFDIAKMPHLLIAGATGSGKSVCINTLILSILYKARPDEVQLIMIDPKVVELSVYNGIPHLLIPVVTDPKKASGALNWGVAEMTRRYNTFASLGVRNIEEYNRKIEEIKGGGAPLPEALKQGEGEGEQAGELSFMSQIVIIVDELADLMMVAPGEVEEAICRLAQLARAAGIHLVLATQRPSVNVITGLIKANMPSRIAFAVSSGVDSRTILDTYGAEKLLGKGDMLFAPQSYPKPVRLQGAFVSDDEISQIVAFLAEQNPEVVYDEGVQQQVETATASLGGEGEEEKERDHFFADAAYAIIDKERCSVSMLQRLFKIGFNRASRLMDQLEEAGIVGPDEGSKGRKVLMSKETLRGLLKES